MTAVLLLVFLTRVFDGIKFGEMGHSKDGGAACASNARKKSHPYRPFLMYGKGTD